MTDKSYDGPERRTQTHLTDEQVEEIAEKAAEKAIEKLTGDVYKAVGKTVISRLLWIVGSLMVGGWLYMKKTGLI